MKGTIYRPFSRANKHGNAKTIFFELRQTNARFDAIFITHFIICMFRLMKASVEMCSIKSMLKNNQQRHSYSFE